MPKKAHKNSHLVGQEVTLTGKVDRVVGHDGVWCWVRLRASENVVKVHVRDLTLRTGTGAKPEPPKAAGLTDKEASDFLGSFTGDQRRTTIADLPVYPDTRPVSQGRSSIKGAFGETEL